ncbi:unnamed protein product [Adineta steineri]|uniref:Uncharacterized protein n=1 Tax=Adineta steineri TaxID=433720 RepID=A0A818P4G5_9BILA|nr:unnamed protein product [Adineta steineri]CAF3615169.1 unnamed protein product [Adineta steineri]
MRLPMSSLSHRIIQNHSLSSLDNDMPSSSTYSFELPYLGVIYFGKSPLNLTSFQKPLRELYISYYREQSHDQRRVIISDSDILILESERGTKSKRSLTYIKFESIVNIQLLKLSMTNKNKTQQQQQHTQVAFLPIGCEYQERFRSLYSSVNKSQYNLLSTRISYHSPLLLFVTRKAGVTGSCSLLDCHVFAVHRESTAFELCDMIRKLVIKRTMSPIISRKESDRQNNDLIDVVRSTTNTLHNPLSSSSLLINDVQHSCPFHDTSKVLTMNSDIHRMSSPCSSSKQRHFIKASSLIQDESDEIVNDLMNIVANEQLKNQTSIKRHASFDQTSSSSSSNDNNTMNKKRYFHNKKRLLNPIPITNNILPQQQQQKIPSMIDGQLFRPQIVLNRYGDIGNYVPKFLREDSTMRSSDSNENIFFRSSNGQLINGFLKLDCLSNQTNNYYQSTPCLNQDQNIYSLVQQLRKNQTKSFTNIYPNDLNISNQILDINVNHIVDDDHQVPHVLKSIGDVMNDNKVHLLTQISHLHQHPSKSNVGLSSSKPKRFPSFHHANTELPIDYRQYLRHTDQGAYLYGEEQRQQSTLEHTLGYLP